MGKSIEWGFVYKIYIYEKVLDIINESYIRIMLEYNFFYQINYYKVVIYNKDIKKQVLAFIIGERSFWF